MTHTIIKKTHKKLISALKAKTKNVDDKYDGGDDENGELE